MAFSQFGAFPSLDNVLGDDEDHFVAQAQPTSSSRRRWFGNRINDSAPLPAYEAGPSSNSKSRSPGGRTGTPKGPRSQSPLLVAGSGLGLRERDLEEHNRRLALLESENERPYSYGRHRHPHATRQHHEQQESHEHGQIHENDGNGAQRDRELNILHVEPSELDRELPPYEAVDSGVPISLRGQVEQALGIQVSMDADGTYTYTTTASTQSPLVTQSQLVDLGYQFYTRDSPAGLVMSSTPAPRSPVTQREVPVTGSENVNVNENASSEGGPSGAGANGNSSASTRANRRRARAVSIDSAIFAEISNHSFDLRSLTSFRTADLASIWSADSDLTLYDGPERERRENEYMQRHSQRPRQSRPPVVTSTLPISDGHGLTSGDAGIVQGRTPVDPVLSHFGGTGMDDVDFDLEGENAQEVSARMSRLPDDVAMEMGARGGQRASGLDRDADLVSELDMGSDSDSDSDSGSEHDEQIGELLDHPTGSDIVTPVSSLPRPSPLRDPDENPNASTSSLSSSSSSSCSVSTERGLASPNAVIATDSFDLDVEMDEQLLREPQAAFAEMCWASAVADLDPSDSESTHDDQSPTSIDFNALVGDAQDPETPTRIEFAPLQAGSKAARAGFARSRAELAGSYGWRRTRMWAAAVTVGQTSSGSSDNDNQNKKWRMSSSEADLLDSAKREMWDVEEQREIEGVEEAPRSAPHTLNNSHAYKNQPSPPLPPLPVHSPAPSRSSTSPISPISPLSPSSPRPVPISSLYTSTADVPPRSSTASPAPSHTYSAHSNSNSNSSTNSRSKANSNPDSRVESPNQASHFLHRDPYSPTPSSSKHGRSRSFSKGLSPSYIDAHPSGMIWPSRVQSPSPLSASVTASNTMHMEMETALVRNGKSVALDESQGVQSFPVPDVMSGASMGTGPGRGSIKRFARRVVNVKGWGGGAAKVLA